MNEFVETCRRAWRGLGVADSVADEMAAELAADLAEAEAQGEDVLGPDASDARAFAAAWATERGVVTRSTRRARRFAVPATIAASALIAISGAVVVIVSPSGPRNSATVSPDGRQLVVQRLQPPVSTPIRVAAPGPAKGTIWVAAELQSVPDSRDGGRTIGLVVLIVGLAGALSLTVLSLRTR